MLTPVSSDEVHEDSNEDALRWPVEIAQVQNVSVVL